VWQILPTLFLGDRTDARDEQRLRREGITHIVNCSKELPCYFERGFAYLWLKLEDPDPAFGDKMPQACEFIRDGCERGRVLVHCTGAVSRSPAVILAYLCHKGDSLEGAARRLSEQVPTGVDELFLSQLASLQGRQLTAPEVKKLENILLGHSSL
jgi:hypothetical protein